jgi:hypothetical protein
VSLSVTNQNSAPIFPAGITSQQTTSPPVVAVNPNDTLIFLSQGIVPTGIGKVTVQVTGSQTQDFGLTPAPGPTVTKLLVPGGTKPLATLQTVTLVATAFDTTNQQVAVTPPVTFSTEGGLPAFVTGSPPSGLNGIVGMPFQGTLNTANPADSITASTIPGLKLTTSPAPPVTGTFTFNPPTPGTFQQTFTAHNGFGDASKTVTFTVAQLTPIITPPIGGPTILKSNINGPTSLAFTVNGNNFAPNATVTLTADNASPNPPSMTPNGTTDTPQIAPGQSKTQIVVYLSLTGSQNNVGIWDYALATGTVFDVTVTNPPLGSAPATSATKKQAAALTQL